MKRVLSLLLLFTILVYLPYVLAEEQVDFWYGMSIKSKDLLPLPTPSIPSSLIYDGLQVQVENMSDSDDTFMLLFVANRRIIPYSFNDSPMAKIHQYKLPANETIPLSISFSSTVLESVESGSFLIHIIVIGLLDKMPIDEFDNMLFYSLAGSLPITGKGAEQEEIDKSEALANRLLSFDEIEGYLNHFRFIDKETGHKASIFQHQYSGSVEIPFSVTGQSDNVAVFFFLDNHLLSLGDNDGLLIKMKESYAFDDILNLELSPGKHQLYAIYVPKEGRIDSFIASEKITINVP